MVLWVIGCSCVVGACIGAYRCVLVVCLYCVLLLYRCSGVCIVGGVFYMWRMVVLM